MNWYLVEKSLFSTPGPKRPGTEHAARSVHFCRGWKIVGSYNFVAGGIKSKMGSHDSFLGAYQVFSVELRRIYLLIYVLVRTKKICDQGPGLWGLRMLIGVKFFNLLLWIFVGLYDSIKRYCNIHRAGASLPCNTNATCMQCCFRAF